MSFIISVDKTILCRLIEPKSKMVLAFSRAFNRGGIRRAFDEATKININLRNSNWILNRIGFKIELQFSIKWGFSLNGFFFPIFSLSLSLALSIALGRFPYSTLSIHYAECIFHTLSCRWCQIIVRKSIRKSGTIAINIFHCQFGFIAIGYNVYRTLQ